jgi:hypothetical protein
MTRHSVVKGTKRTLNRYEVETWFGIAAVRAAVVWVWVCNSSDFEFQSDDGEGKYHWGGGALAAASVEKNKTAICIIHASFMLQKLSV